MGISRVWTLRTSSRAALSGAGTSRIRSKRPVRRSAGSIKSGRFVAPITTTSSRLSRPSMDVRSWFTTRSLTPLSLSIPRRWAIASSSSRNTMQGATCFAFLKIMRTAFSDSPTHFDMTSGPLIEMKFDSLSVATAFARRVFPLPGGPDRRTPRGGRIPRRRKDSGSLRHLDGLPKLHLHVLEAADVGPLDPRDLDEDLPHRTGLDLLEGVLEVVRRHSHPLEDLRGDGLLEVELRQVPPEGLHGGLPREGREVRSDEAVGHVREFREKPFALLLRSLDGHPAGVDLEDLLQAFPIRHADLDLPVEAARPPEGGVDRLVPVRRADHDDLAPAREAVHEGQELGDDAPLDLPCDLLPLRGDRVEFVDEQDARGVLLGLLKLLAEALLALPVVLRHDLGALDRGEVGPRLVGHGLRDEGLPRPRRAVQEDALRRVDPEPLEELRVLQGELDHLADLHELLLEAADVLVGDRRGEDLAFPDGLLLHLDNRVVVDLDDALGLGLDDHEREGSTHEGDPGDDDDVPLRHGPLVQASLHEVLDPLPKGDLVALADDRRG